MIAGATVLGCLCFILIGSCVKEPRTIVQPWIVIMLSILLVAYPSQFMQIYYIKQINCCVNETYILGAAIAGFLSSVSTFTFTWLFAFKYFQASSVLAAANLSFTNMVERRNTI